MCDVWRVVSGVRYGVWYVVCGTGRGVCGVRCVLCVVCSVSFGV